MKTVREIVTEYNESKGWDTDDATLLETIMEERPVHCELGYEHRWYMEELIVVQIGEHLLRYNGFHVTGDNCASDMGLEVELDDVQIVEKRTKTVTKTYYEAVV